MIMMIIIIIIINNVVVVVVVVVVPLFLFLLLRRATVFEKLSVFSNLTGVKLGRNVPVNAHRLTESDLGYDGVMTP